MTLQVNCTFFALKALGDGEVAFNHLFIFWLLG